MENKCTINIEVYDPAIVKAPFKLITLESYKVSIVPSDGDDRFIFLSEFVKKLGYLFRFYSMPEKNTYDVCVHNQNSPGSPFYGTNHLNEKSKIPLKENYNESNN